MKLNIVFIDNNNLFVKNALEFLGRNFKLGRKDNIKDLQAIPRQAEDLNLHLIFVDLSLLYRVKGFDFCREIRDKYPRAKIIGLSLFENQIIGKSENYNCIHYYIDKDRFYNCSIDMVRAFFPETIF